MSSKRKLKNKIKRLKKERGRLADISGGALVALLEKKDLQ